MPKKLYNAKVAAIDKVQKRFILVNAGLATKANIDDMHDGFVELLWQHNSDKIDVGRRGAVQRADVGFKVLQVVDGLMYEQTQKDSDGEPCHPENCEFASRIGHKKFVMTQLQYC